MIINMHFLKQNNIRNVSNTSHSYKQITKKHTHTPFTLLPSFGVSSPSPFVTILRDIVPSLSGEISSPSIENQSKRKIMKSDELKNNLLVLSQ